MNKIKILFIVIFSTFIIGFLFSLNKISNAKNVDILTKNTIFDIIDDVDGVIITCISKDGENNLSDENRLDCTLLYIIQNRDKFNIVENKLLNLDLNQEMIVIGKINQKDFEKQFKNIFTNFKHKINEYKYADGEYINLVYEPCDFFIYDTKELLYSRFVNNVYEVVYKYTRSLNNSQHIINVKYIFTTRMKIKDVIILSSNVR